MHQQSNSRDTGNRTISDEIDLIVIGSTGLFVVEVKHRDHSYLKNQAIAVEQEATKPSGWTRSSNFL